jgi:hypothetical protein
MPPAAPTATASASDANLSGHGTCRLTVILAALTERRRASNFFFTAGVALARNPATGMTVRRASEDPDRGGGGGPGNPGTAGAG